MTNPQTEARAIATVRKWLDGGCSSWGLPSQEIAILITALAAKDAELAEVRAYAFEATKAITSLTVGGSEFFGKRIGEMYTADLPYCVEHIKDRERRAHKRWLEEREKRQRAEAQLAEANKALENLERKLCAAEHGHTVNEVLANYREIRRGVQDARSARRAREQGGE